MYVCLRDEWQCTSDKSQVHMLHNTLQVAFLWLYSIYYRDLLYLIALKLVGCIVGLNLMIHTIENILYTTIMNLKLAIHYKL